MRVITLGYDSEGKASLLIGPEVRPTEHKSARLAARAAGSQEGIVRMETYTIDAGNRIGVTVIPTSNTPAKTARKKSKE